MAPLHPPLSLPEALGAIFAQAGIDPRAWALGFARATPAVTLIPAFGLAAVPAPTRLVLGLSLGLCIAPALSESVHGSGPLLLALGREAFAGLPVALLASLSMYVAAAAGALVDDLRGARESVTLPTLPEPLPPIGVLFALLASIAFLETGGAARVAAALASPLLSSRFSWSLVVRAFAGAVELAFAIAAPLAVASVLLEAGSALIARAATPAFVGPVLAPLKSVALLGVLALVFERIAELLVLLTATFPH
jgi:type III secretory pathway component EscT